MSFGKDIDTNRGEEAPKNLFPNVSINLNYPLKYVFISQASLQFINRYDKTSIDGDFTSTNRDKPWSNLREESMIGKLGVTHKFNDNLSGTLSVNARYRTRNFIFPINLLDR